MSHQNIIDLTILQKMSQACNDLANGPIYRVLYLIALLDSWDCQTWPPSLDHVDAPRYLTGSDIILYIFICRLVVKWP